MNKSNILVITGGMGTGKSTVLNLFKKNGFIVINSDDEVTQLFKSTYSKYKNLAKDFDDLLGSNFSSLNEINKKDLRPLLEQHPDGFVQSMKIVKPYISERLNELEKEYSGQKLVFEIPLLFEANIEPSYNHILVITAPLDIRIERIKKRQPHLSIEQINQTITAQKDDSYKIAQATYVLNNNSSLMELENKFNVLLPLFESIYTSSII